jgi:haloacetate dehalogenase
MTRDADDPMEAEFDTVAEWTAEVAVGLGPEYLVSAACRGSGKPAALDWLLAGLRAGPGDLLADVGAGLGGPAAYAADRAGVRPVLVEPAPDACRAAARLFGAPVIQGDATALPFADGAVSLAWSLGVLCTAPLRPDPAIRRRHRAEPPHRPPARHRSAHLPGHPAQPRVRRGIMTTLLPGFEYQHVEVEGVTVNCATAGSGSPVLMLHGYPQNHLMWRDVAPALAEDHTVVLADLRGYGDSGKPEPDAAGDAYSKRSMARDQLGLMRELGFAQFQLVGHDRGARVSHRLALDHPEAVTRLAVLDIVPTRHIWHNVTRDMATAYYHWFFLPVGNGIPEHLIGADPGFWVRSIVGALLGQGASLDAAVMEDYIRCFSDPRTIAGSCADYRSAASIDLVHDDETFAAGRKLECPVLVLWGSQGFVGRGYHPLSVWQEYAIDARGEALPTGHFLPEEAPPLVTVALRGFLT